jgi:hypothetical protein
MASLVLQTSSRLHLEMAVQRRKDADVTGHYLTCRLTDDLSKT